MNAQGLNNRCIRRVLWCLLLLTVASLAFAQLAGDPQQLLKSGIARIDHWADYVRRTGDAKSTVTELAEAQLELQSSFDLFMRRQDFAGASFSALKLGHTYRLVNQSRAALPVYQQAVELAQRAQRQDYQTTALAYVAFTELQLDEIDAAQQHATEAVRLGVNCGNRDYYFEALDTAAEVEVKRGNLVAAGDYLDRALAMSAEVDKKKLYLGYMDHADIHEQMARKCDYQRTMAASITPFYLCYQWLEKARTDYEKALAITQELGYAYYSQMFKDFLKELDERKNLITMMQRGDPTISKARVFNPKQPEDVRVTEQFTSGSMSADAGRSSGFDPYMIRLVENYRRDHPVEDNNPDDMCLEGQFAEIKGDYDGALRAYLHANELIEKDRRKLGSEQARSAFLEDKIACFNRPALLLLDRKRQAEAFTIFERSRSRAMADLLASRPLNLASEQERSLFSELQTLQNTIATQQKKLFNLDPGAERQQNTKKMLQNQITDLQQNYAQLESRIGREAPKLKELTATETVSLTALQHSAANGNYDVLYYVVMEPELILWHVNREGVQTKNVFLPHSLLVKKVSALRESLTARGAAAQFDAETSRQLFLFLVQPVLPFIKTNRLIVIPHEELNSIPFQALQNPQTGKYLGENFAISYAPSATVLLGLQGHPTLKGTRLLAVADPVIEAVTQEVNAIAKLYPGTNRSVTQTAASKSDIKKWVKDYNVVHLSVHGRFYESDPLSSYLQFKNSPPDNGQLTAAEMFGLPLQKNSLVVLSACETARVEATHSNEVFGMVRSLLYAGAGTLVLSLWEVDVSSTRLWMETFYQQAQTNSLAEAARKALVAVKSRPEYAHPFFWAPFITIGN